MDPITEFVEATPTPENHFRSVILFGRNVASYKFALGGALLELASQEQEFIKMEQLAEPFARRLCEHIAVADKQSTSGRSKFLDSCRSFNRGEISHSALVETTTRLGFLNVIDAFHVVGTGEISRRFYYDERKAATKGIRLTDDLLTLAKSHAEQTLTEVEARWRLVETAWELGVNRTLIDYESSSGMLLPNVRRQALTSARDSLNGYQKGKCFYCYRAIGTTPKAANLADVDHLFPHSFQRRGLFRNLDQVWNLVLACQDCNRGPHGKFDAIPDAKYVTRLMRRNEYLIGSHHPLRDTLIMQTGGSTKARAGFLQNLFSAATEIRPGTWTTKANASANF
jgi:hypothetical protein